MSVAYVDASALTKLILDEPSSDAMFRWYVKADQVFTSVVGAIETRRAVARQTAPMDRLDVILRSIDLIELDPRVRAAAATVQPPRLRTLDAIHLASAQGLVGQLDAFVTYDDRLAEAARIAGLPVFRPA